MSRTPCHLSTYRDLLHSFWQPHHIPQCYCITGLPKWPSGKESACHCRRYKRLRFDPWIRKIPWSREWQRSPVFFPWESYGQRNLEGYGPWDHKELDTTEQLCTHTIHLLSPPLQDTEVASNFSLWSKQCGHTWTYLIKLVKIFLYHEFIKWKVWGKILVYFKCSQILQNCPPKELCPFKDPWWHMWVGTNGSCWNNKGRNAFQMIMPKGMY